MSLSLLDVLCGWVLWKVCTYYFIQGDEDKGEVVESTVRSIMQAAGRFIVLFVLGSYSGAGLWHGSVFLLCCLDSFFHRRQQCLELKVDIEEVIRRHEN